MAENKNPSAKEYSEMTACELKNEDPSPEVDQDFQKTAVCLRYYVVR